jgi:hypothetical protein
MGETLLVLTLVTLVILTIRRARPVILDSPVIIQRPGQYHITLAPQLNRAQTFVEQLARHFSLLHLTQRDLPSQYFEVRDPNVFSKGEDCYLLAIALREGIFYFQAINPQPLIHDADSHYKTLHEFSETVLKQHPFSEAADEPGCGKLRAGVDAVAGQLKIAVKVLQATD